MSLVIFNKNFLPLKKLKKNYKYQYALKPFLDQRDDQISVRIL
jgi:hypothetical protein